MSSKLSQKIDVRADSQLKMCLEDIADEREISVGALVREILKRSVRQRRAKAGAAAGAAAESQSDYFSV